MSVQNNVLFDILKEAISIEIYGQEYYSIFSDFVSDENAKSILKGLSRDEQDHRKLLEKEYKKLSGNVIDIKILDEKNKEKARKLFPESIGSFSLTETNEALKLGIRTEERSIEFYTNSAKVTKDTKSKDLFLKLTNIEKGHKQLLKEALYYLEQEGTWYGYSPPTIEG